MSMTLTLNSKECNIDMTVNNFNNFHPRLKFTVELDGNSLNFLDVTLIKKDNTLCYMIDIINQLFQCDT